MSQHYITIQEGQFHQTREVVSGLVFVDEDAEGNVLGVEVLDGQYRYPDTDAETKAETL